MKKSHFFFPLLFACSAVLGQEFTVPDIVIPDTPNYRWKVDLINGVGGSPFFDNGGCWNGGSSPFGYGSVSYANSRYIAADKGSIVFDTGEARSYTGLVVSGTTELYISSFLECNQRNGFTTETYVSGGGTINQTAGTFQLDRGNLFIGEQGVGTYNISGGTYQTFAVSGSSANGILLGNGANGDGRLNVSGNANINLSNSIIVGYTGASQGTLTVVGGTVIGGGNLQLGREGAATGTVNLSGGTVQFGTLQVGVSGTGIFNQSGGAMSAGTVTVGNDNGSEGTLSLSGKTLTSSGSFMLGVSTGAQGTVTLSSGTLTVKGPFAVGGGSNENTDGGGTGTFIQTGGTLNVGAVGGEVGFSVGLGKNSGGEMTFTNGKIYASTFNVGFGNSGTFNQYGGDIYTTNYFCVGNKGNAANVGTYNMYGGTITSKWLPLGHQRSAEFNMYDGLINVTSGNGLVIGDTGSGRCNFSMYGGTIDSQPQITIGSSSGAIGSLSVYGGTIEAKNGLKVGSGGKGTLDIYGGAIHVTGNLTSNAQSSVGFYATPYGVGTLDVTGSIPAGLKINVSSVGLALLENYNTTLGQEGLVVMTVGSGTEKPTVTVSSDFYTAAYADNKLRISLNDSMYKGVLSAASGSLDWASAVQGWVSLEDLNGNDPFELSFNVSGLTADKSNDFKKAIESAISETAGERWTVSLSDDFSKLTLGNINPSAFDNNMFAWDLSGASYGGAAFVGAHSQQVPEPATWTLLVLGAVGIGILRRKR